MENKTLASVRNLTIGYEDKVLCSGISFDIREGDCIMLCGANGSGKTTLMKALAKKSNFHLPDSSTNTADSKWFSSTEDKAECIMIPARIPKVAGFTLREFVRVSCFNKSDLFGKLSPSEEAALNQAISTLGLDHLADRDISTLSDGEFQKAGIASALVRKADIILLDEPTAFLDAENRISVLKTLRDISEGYPHTQNSPENGVCHRTEVSHRPAIIFSTHDLYDGLQVCTKVFALGADHNFHCSSESTQESKAATVSCIFSR
jgi:iron complex transport system ATP-binding protein